jgi:nucleoside-triphosphatase THEP1
MKIAYTMSRGRGDTDLLLGRLADRLLARGCRVSGTVQINTECDADEPCDMDVRVLPDGPVIRISQSLGKDARGCRLDPDALETAVGLVEASLGRDADLLIINKFGKHEADGRGFRSVIGEALARDIPVLVGLNPLNEERFQEFAGGMAEDVRATVEDLERWAIGHFPAVDAAPVSA